MLFGLLLLVSFCFLFFLFFFLFLFVSFCFFNSSLFIAYLIRLASVDGNASGNSG